MKARPVCLTLRLGLLAAQYLHEGDCVRKGAGFPALSWLEDVGL